LEVAGRVATLGITSLSKSQVSRMAAELDEQVAAFRTRPLGESGPFTFVAADALTMKVREHGRVVNAVVLVATGVNADGHRQVLGVKVATSETTEAWNTFFADLVARAPCRGPAGHQRCARRAGGGDRREPARGILAAL
jgi:transposase-like protein